MGHRWLGDWWTLVRVLGGGVAVRPPAVEPDPGEGEGGHGEGGEARAPPGDEDGGHQPVVRRDRPRGPPHGIQRVGGGGGLPALKRRLHPRRAPGRDHLAEGRHQGEAGEGDAEEEPPHQGARVLHPCGRGAPNRRTDIPGFMRNLLLWGEGSMSWEI